MFELLVEGPDSRQRCRFSLADGDCLTVGRETSVDCPVPWDRQISRKHVSLSVEDACVQIEKLSQAVNPLFINGVEVQSARLRSGEHFVLGTTSFRLLDRDSGVLSPSDQPIEQVTFQAQDLQKIHYRDADRRLDVLSHLPELIWGARTDEELYQRLTGLLLAGVNHADAVAIVRLNESQRLEISHWDRRRETSGEFHPSSRLVSDALQKRCQTVLHVWESSQKHSSDYTQIAEFDWAFCTPIPSPVDDPWGLYIAGKHDRPFVDGGTVLAGGEDLTADVKFTELVAEIISSVQRLNRMERHQAGLRQFFAPPILSALGEDLDTTILEPRECDVTVMFCDLRGFSQQAEESADDLKGLLNRVSGALEVMTYHILEHGGVTGDFQGDATLGFWGWPFASEEAPLQACRAALGIRQAFADTQNRPDHPLFNFQMGIGIAHGRAVAGKIGTSDQVKVSVFGPVVNLASRLEGLTKQLRVPILLDEPTAEIVRSYGPCAETEFRIRKLAKILPYGMETTALVHELLPSSRDYTELQNEHLTQYERGVDCFISGEWEEAYRYLH